MPARPVTGLPARPITGDRKYIFYFDGRTLFNSIFIFVTLSNYSTLELFCLGWVHACLFYLACKAST
jgi:hypothetical protein